MEEPTPELDPREKRRSAVSGEGAAHPLAVWRDRHGLSMKKFGQMARTSASTVCQIEHKMNLLPRGHQMRS